MLLEKLITVLGEDNVKRLEDGITDIILEQIESDFDEYSKYLISPDDVEKFAEKCKEKAFANIEAEVVKRFENRMKAALLDDGVK